MQVTTHRVLLYSNGDHAFLVEGSKIKEVLVTVINCLFSNLVFYGGKNSI